MPDTAARLAIVARRNEVCRFTIAVRGIDLTNIAMAMQVRLKPDTPGSPRIALATVQTLAAEGLKLDSVSFVNGVPTSIIKGRINQTTMSDPAILSYSGEVGDDNVFAYALTWTIGGDTQTRIYGDFIARASAWNSDNAPANRPLGYGGGAAAGAPTSGTLQFGDQVIAVSIDGAEYIQSLIGSVATTVEDAQTQIDEAASAATVSIAASVGAATTAAATAAANRDKAFDWAELASPPAPGGKSAKTWAGIAGGSATLAAQAQGVVEQVRDTFSATAATAQAAVIAAAGGQYQTISSGLAATAPDGYFYVASGGDVFTTLYRKVNGAAVLVNVLSGQSALDRVGRAISAAPGVDNAPSLNAVLQQSLVRGALLPDGGITIRRIVLAPSGTRVSGGGMGVTSLVAMDGFATTDGYFNALIGSEMGAVAVSISDLTCDGQKISQTDAQLKGVVMYRARDFLVERVSTVDINSYAFWAASTTGQATKPSGIFRTIRSENAQVHFESSGADGVLWDILEYGGGDGDIGCEAVVHTTSGSKNITVRRLRQISPCGGNLVSIAANEGLDSTGIELIDLKGEVTGDNVVLSLIASGDAGATNRIEVTIDGGDMRGDGLALQGVRASIALKGTPLWGRSNEGLSLSDNSHLRATGVPLRVSPNSPAAKVTPFAVDATSSIDFDGGSIWYDCTSENANTSLPGNIRVSRTTRIGRGPGGASPISGEAPVGIGAVVQRTTAVDQVLAGDDGLSTFAFVTAANTTYRVRFSGTMKGAASGNTGVVIRAFYTGGTPGRSVSGIATMTANENGTVPGSSAPLFASSGYDGAGIYAALGEKRAGFTLDFNLTAAGENFVQIASASVGTLLTGASFEVVRTA